MLDRTRFTRLLDAAEETGVAPHTLVEHALAGRLKLTHWVDDVEYREVVADVVRTNGVRERLPMPPHFVPEGGAPTVPEGPYPLSPGAASRALSHGREGVPALEDGGGDVYRLARPLQLTPSDVLLDREEWESFKKEHRADLRAQKKARSSARSTPGSSMRDAERLALGADALVSLRRAAHRLPGSDKENRRVIVEAGLVRKHGKRQLVRWGDVVELFPTEARLAELAEGGVLAPTAQPRGSRRPRGVGLRLADL